MLGFVFHERIVAVQSYKQESVFAVLSAILCHEFYRSCIYLLNLSEAVLMLPRVVYFTSVDYYFSLCTAGVPSVTRRRMNC